MYYHNLNVIRKGSKKLLKIKNSKSIFNTKYLYISTISYSDLLACKRDIVFVIYKKNKENILSCTTPL